MAARKPKKTLTSKPNVIKKNTGTKKLSIEYSDSPPVLKLRIYKK